MTIKLPVTVKYDRPNNEWSIRDADGLGIASTRPVEMADHIAHVLNHWAEVVGALSTSLGWIHHHECCNGIDCSCGAGEKIDLIQRALAAAEVTK